jgi:hypothetical protein
MSFTQPARLNICVGVPLFALLVRARARERAGKTNPSFLESLHSSQQARQDYKPYKSKVTNFYGMLKFEPVSDLEDSHARVCGN